MLSTAAAGRARRCWLLTRRLAFRRIWLFPNAAAFNASVFGGSAPWVVWFYSELCDGCKAFNPDWDRVVADPSGQSDGSDSRGAAGAELKGRPALP
eukprot:gene22081-9873_t